MKLAAIMKKAKYVGWAEDEVIDGVQKHNDVDYWLYYEVYIADKPSYINIKRTKRDGDKPHAIETEEDFNKKEYIKKESPIR